MRIRTDTDVYHYNTSDNKCIKYSVVSIIMNFIAKAFQSVCIHV